MYESDVERRYKKKILDVGGVAYKFISPGRRGVPDRLVMLPIPEEHRELINKYIWFTELKAPGKKPGAHQLNEIRALRKLGMRVDVIDG
jgi:hypothetical protein